MQNLTPEALWKSFGNLVHLNKNQTPSLIPIMMTTDFPVFRALISAVSFKAFGEPLAKLSYRQSQMLSWLIFEATGTLLSYKSLANYFEAIPETSPKKVNPSVGTLLALAEYVMGAREAHNLPPLLRWLHYRQALIQAA